MNEHGGFIYFSHDFAELLFLLVLTLMILIIVFIVITVAIQFNVPIFDQRNKIADIRDLGNSKFSLGDRPIFFLNYSHLRHLPLQALSEEEDRKQRLECPFM